MKKASKNNEKKQQAQFLYMAGNKTQKEIADTIGVSERSVHSWIHQYAWDKLRLAAFQAPVTIADNLAAQVVELQNVIAAREVGNRFPTPQEAEVSRKIITSWERMKKYPSLSQSMQVLETFRNYIRPIDKDFARDLGKYIKDFTEAKAVNGYAPYQVEYGVDQVSPVLPFYDEVEGLDANDTTKALCPDHLTCLYPGKCNYPYCMKEKEREITIDDYKVSPVLFTRNNPQKTEIVPAASGSDPAIPTSETRKNDLSADLQITLATANDPAIPLSQELGLKGGPHEQGPAFSAGGAEGGGFNRDRYMELLKKLHNIVDDDGTANVGTPPDATAESGSNPATFTSESRKNESEENPQNANDHGRSTAQKNTPYKPFLPTRQKQGGNGRAA